MNIESHVINLELSKRLKELGVKQHSYFKWEERESGYTELFHSKGTSIAHKYYSAFLASELGEMLQPIILSRRTDNYLYLKFMKNNAQDTDIAWLCSYISDHEQLPEIYSHSKTEADARAKMLIYLIENKLIELLKEET